MVRARLAALVVTSGLGLACGCSYLGNHSFFNCHGPAPCVGCEAGSIPVTEGPILQDYNPAVVPQPAAPGGVPVLSGSPPTNGPTDLTPQPTVPPLSTPPRLTPQPQQAPVEPYRP
jgi:hypothetical protein